MYINKKCIICDINCTNNKYKVLTNGSLYHTYCMDNLNNSLKILNRQIFNLNEKGYKIKKEIINHHNIFYKIISIFNTNKLDKIFLEKESLVRRICG